MQGRVVTLCQHGDALSYKVLGRAPHVDPATDADVITDYLNLGVQLSKHQAQWTAADKRFAALAPYIQGARVLRQPPLECLFSFVCSSNNHISRIAGMVERLCIRYGSPIDVVEGAAEDVVPRDSLKDVQGGEGQAWLGNREESDASSSDGTPVTRYYSFPTLQQLERSTEEELYADGFGYRCGLY